MRNLTRPLVALTAGALLLAGCSTGAGDGTGTPSADPSAAPSAAPSAGGMPQGGPSRGGVSGEIVFAHDGLLQVQDGSSQTAVRYSAATTVNEQVAIALADVETGSCVVAVVAEDGTATSVTLTEPVGGECAAGFGGMGAPGGDGQPGAMPSGAPTAMPSGAPTAMPSGAPGDGAFPGGDFAGSFVNGTVAAVTATGLTVTTTDGEATVTIGADSTITGTQAADAAAITVGLCLTAQGTADNAGGFDATSVTLSQKGEAGCVARGFGGMGGQRGTTGNAGSNG